MLVYVFMILKVFGILPPRLNFDVRQDTKGGSLVVCRRLDYDVPPRVADGARDILAESVRFAVAPLPVPLAEQHATSHRSRTRRYREPPRCIVCDWSHVCGCP